MRGESVSLFVACCFLALNAFGVTQYTVTEFPSRCNYFHPWYAGVSNEGHVVAEWCIDGYSRGYIWQAGVTTDLGHLGGNACFAEEVNSSGQVTGASHISVAAVHAYRWDSGVMTDLGVLPGGYSSAGFGINESGVVVGYSYDSADRLHACVWVGTTLTDLGTLGGSDAMARGINDQGEVVGNADDPHGDDHAFLWLPTGAYGLSAGMNDLGTFGGDTSKALGINNQGQIIGGRVTTGGDWQPWIWENGSITYLGGLGGDYTTPEDINNLGQVVGGSSTAAYDWHAILWESGSMYDLNNYIPGGSGWELTHACGINDSGWIVGYGTHNGVEHLFLLKPVPEPGMALLAVGALGLLLRRRNLAKASC